MQELKIVIAGAGAISEFHLKGWQAQEGVTLAAICDPDEGKARARAEEFGIPAVYTDVAEMLEATQPDAIDIITPVASHAPLVEMAADRGVHVMCQKPLTPTVAEAEALIEKVGERVRFMVHENYRFRPHFAEVAQRVQAGEVGRVRHARMTVRSSSMYDYPGRVPFLLGRQPYMGSFRRLVVFEVLIHHLDALRSIFGEMVVESATLDQINPELEGEDVALVTLRTRDGALVVIDANISALGYPPLPTDRLEVLGEADSLVLDREVLRLMSREEPVTVHDLKANYQACFTGAVSAFVTGLREGTPFPTDRLDNLETLRLMEGIYVAAGVAI
ncbi:Gfo/Idh/MocA family protein [Oceanicola sp. D3]|uniref:Gfo/Idh/MocA family protein n=1 Tax=Oceanicola sp. D3 TaxID=2587163 RepID=UPI00143D7C13|nr:Gfo/Idh/MocA family oxidoreductase [Oceanicola sp. D3]